MPKSGLQSEIAHQILSLAAQERWPKGQRISDQALSRQLGVSRTPVRAALVLLGERGVVRQVHGRGFELLRVPVPDEINDIAPPSEEETLYRKLMADRAGGILADEVSEAELSQRYDVPRGTLRKVLLRFSADGLIHRQRGHGWIFAESLVSAPVVAESYAFRLVVECGALKQSTFSVDAQELEMLRSAQQHFLEVAETTIGRDEWFSANAQFHETLASWSHNRFLVQAVRQQNNLRRITEYADFDKLSSGHVHSACSEHIAILDALKDNDTEFAEALLRRHIERAARFDL